jgi:hypothetical protein
MAVDQTDLIDFVSTGADATVMLGIADHLSWTDEAHHLQQLQHKLNRYLDFLNSGELAETFPQSADCRPIVRVHFVNSPTATAEQFLSKAASSIEAEGVMFTYDILQSSENA